MSGPWEEYQSQPAAKAASPAPWEDYAAPAPAAKPAAKAAKKREWSDVPLEALGNIPSSAGNLVSGIAQAVMNPLDTAKNLVGVADGAVRNLLPDGGAGLDRLRGGDANKVKAIREQNIATADATGQFFKDRYGSMEGLKGTLATDPVGALADASSVLTGGAGALRLGSKAAVSAAARGVPGAATGSALLAGGGQALRRAGDAINPVGMAVKGGAKAAEWTGKGAAHIIGGLGTHTGAETIKQAYSGGRKGGVDSRSVTDNMRGKVEFTDVLDDMKANLSEMSRAKSEAYKQNMAAVRSDQSILSFDGIDAAVAKAYDIATFNGKAKSPKAAEVQQSIAAIVDDWKASDPAKFHTPEGLDALKQRIYAEIESVPLEQKTARTVGGDIYNAVKAEIVKQAPVYADTMKAYSESSELITEIERALSLGKKASADTAMRKLQSLMRNNVNTNYSNRLSLANELERQGGRSVMPALAGQALSSWTPRGLGSATALGSGGVTFMAGGMGPAAGVMAMQSPRLMGEAAHLTGQAVRMGSAPARAAGGLLNRAGVDPLDLSNILFQAGRLPQE